MRSAGWYWGRISVEAHLDLVVGLAREDGSARLDLASRRTGVHLLDAACCNEQILSREAIRSHPRSAYAQLAASMESSPGLRWGASMERANSALFSTMCRERMRDDEELWARVAST